MTLFHMLEELRDPSRTLVSGGLLVRMNYNNECLLMSTDQDPRQMRSGGTAFNILPLMDNK
jgi:hypothetical protein